MKIQYRGYTISDKNSRPYGYEWYLGNGETLDGPGSLHCGSAGSIQQAKEEIDDDIAEEKDLTGGNDSMLYDHDLPGGGQ